MEFLCGRRAASPPGNGPAPSDARPSGEKAVTSAAPDKRRSRRAALPLWRPSLASISEDGASAGAPTPAAVKSGGAGRKMVKKKPNSSKPPAVKDVYKHFGSLPTFTPTAFLF
ncbi:uncharacterized protein LOC121975821 [Zingiber officinale]|uniref:uncharacterized protein LOC121975821 n=1 Tax=Zingiber officinale TaxID=94328 RepID=UPI001C4CC272|nr:uncharacterized protein LOC121975821 [Zingiber officinale]